MTPIVGPQTPLARRLEDVRQITGYGGQPLKKFWDALGFTAKDRGYGSYAAARLYHLGKDQRDRERDAPVAYLARIVEVFAEVNPAWLLTGVGERTRARAAAARQVGEASAGSRPLHAFLKGPPAQTEDELALDLYLNLRFALTVSLNLTGPAEVVLQSYFYDLLDVDRDAPTKWEGILALFKNKFPQTIIACERGDGPATQSVLFTEAALVYAVDFLSPTMRDADTPRHSILRGPKSEEWQRLAQLGEIVMLEELDKERTAEAATKRGQQQPKKAAGATSSTKKKRRAQPRKE